MTRARSARGEIVNFELLAIKQQLASNPAPKSVEDRRRFIDEKDGVRTVKPIEQESVANALLVGIEAAEESVKAIEKEEVQKKK